MYWACTAGVPRRIARFTVRNWRGGNRKQIIFYRFSRRRMCVYILHTRNAVMTQTNSRFRDSTRIQCCYSLVFKECVCVWEGEGVRQTDRIYTWVVIIDVSEMFPKRAGRMLPKYVFDVQTAYNTICKYL